MAPPCSPASCCHGDMSCRRVEEGGRVDDAVEARRPRWLGWVKWPVAVGEGARDRADSLEARLSGTRLSWTLS